MVSNSPSAREGIARPMPTYYITPPREKQEEIAVLMEIMFRAPSQNRSEHTLSRDDIPFFSQWIKNNSFLEAVIFCGACLMKDEPIKFIVMGLTTLAVMILLSQKL